MKILKAVLFCGVSAAFSIMDLACGLIMAPVMLLLTVISLFTDKVDWLLNSVRKVRMGIAWLFLLPTVPFAALTFDVTMTEVLLDYANRINNYYT